MNCHFIFRTSSKNWRLFFLYSRKGLLMVAPVQTIMTHKLILPLMMSVTGCGLITYQHVLNFLTSFLVVLNRVLTCPLMYTKIATKMASSMLTSICATKSEIICKSLEEPRRSPRTSLVSASGQKILQPFFAGLHIDLITPTH